MLIRVLAALCLTGAAPLDCIRHRTQRPGDDVVTDPVVHLLAASCRLQQPGVTQDRQVPRDDRNVHRAAIGDLADRARPATPGQLDEQIQPRGIRKRPEEPRRDGLFQPPAATMAAERIIARLRHRAIIVRHPAEVKQKDTPGVFFYSASSRTTASMPSTTRAMRAKSSLSGVSVGRW